MQQITCCKMCYFEFTTYIKNELHLLILIQYLFNNFKIIEILTLLSKTKISKTNTQR